MSGGGRRIRRHCLIAAGSLGATAVLALVFPGPDRARISLATAYVALALLTVTLSLGPLNVLRGRPNPVSFNLRRDFGIWSAVLGVGHTAFGLTVHFTGRMQLYFLPPPDTHGLLGLRADSFGAANHSGLLAVLILVVLASISNDRALRTLGTRRWRSVQRWAYVILGFTIVHGALYQLIEKQRLVLVLVFVALALWIVVLQLAGRQHFRVGRRED